MHIAGLVLARGGSKGIPLKNMALLRGRPLVHWALSSMLACQEFDSVWVSTDHEAIADYASTLQVKVHRRSAITATDEASSLLAVEEFLDNYPDIDAVGLVQCTSPFVRPDDLRQAIDRMRRGYDSVFSVTVHHQLRWTKDSCGTIAPANFDRRSRPRRQDWSGELCENGMFYFARRNIVLQDGILQGGKMSTIEIPLANSIDIDSAYDLWMAEQHALYFDLEPCNTPR